MSGTSDNGGAPATESLAARRKIKYLTALGYRILRSERRYLWFFLMLSGFAFFLLWGASLIAGIPASFSQGFETINALSQEQTPMALDAASYAWSDVWGRLLFSAVSIAALVFDGALGVRMARIYHAFAERGRLHELL